MTGEVQTGRQPAAAETLLEREVELSAVAGLLERAGTGRGGFMLFEGPAGMGKSALVDRAAGLAREAGFDVLRARGHELERAFGWGVARALLEPWLASATEAEREELLAG